MDSKKRTLRRLGFAGVATAMTTIGLPAFASAATLAPHAEGAAARPSNLAVPNAPTGLKATDAAANQITLSWTAPSGSVSGYNIYQGTSSGGETTTPVNGSVLVSGTSTTVTVSTTGTYYFQVTAVNAAGQSSASNEASATAAAIAPSAPTGLTATPSASAVTLNWSAPATGDTPTSYQIWQGTASGSETTLAATVSGSQTTDYISGLNDGTTYYFVVKAINAAGTGPASNQASAMPNTGLVPPAPTASATPGNGSITVSWTENDASANGVTGYNVYEGSKSGGESSTPINGSIPISPSVSSVTVAATNGTTEYFTVKAVSSAGMSPASPEVSATPQPSANPSAPTISGIAGYQAVTLKWSPPSSSGNSPVKTYRVYDYNITAGQTSANATSFSSTSSTSATASGLTSADTYGFFVVAVNADGETSSHSNIVTEQPDVTGPPSAPLSLRVSTTANGTTPVNTLSWNAPANAGSANSVSYNVYEGTPTGSHTYLASTSSTTYTQSTGLNPATSYSYYVQAATVLGVSGASNGATITTGDATPGAPTGLAAAPVTTSGSVSLSWNAPADQGLGNLTYSVLIDGAAPTGTELVTTTSGSTSATVSGLSATTQYSFTVQANSASSAGGTPVAHSGPSNSVSVTPTAPSAPTNAPTGLTATAASATSIALSWTAPTAGGGTPTGYDVYETNSSGVTTSTLATNVASTSFTATGLTTGTTYYFRVAAEDQGHVGPESSTASAVPGPTPPAAPTALKAVDNGNLVDLSWKAPSNNGGAAVTGYNIYESGTGFGASITGPVNGNVMVSGTNAEISGLTAGTPVDLYVKAVNSAGASAYSSPVEITPSTSTTPGAPGTPQVQPEPGGRALVVWTAPSSSGSSPVTAYFVTAHLVGGKGKTVRIGATSTTMTGLTSGRYYFTVVAINALGGGTPSAPSAFVDITSVPPKVRVYMTPPAAMAHAGNVLIRVTTNQPGARVQLFDQPFGGHFFSKAIKMASPSAFGNGVAVFSVHIAKTNHFYALVDGVRSNVVTAMVR
jgi:titin